MTYEEIAWDGGSYQHSTELSRIVREHDKEGRAKEAAMWRAA